MHDAITSGTQLHYLTLSHGSRVVVVGDARGSSGVCSFLPSLEGSGQPQPPLKANLLSCTNTLPKFTWLHAGR